MDLSPKVSLMPPPPPTKSLHAGRGTRGPEWLAGAPTEPTIHTRFIANKVSLKDSTPIVDAVTPILVVLLLQVGKRRASPRILLERQIRNPECQDTMVRYVCFDAARRDERKNRPLVVVVGGDG